MNSLRSLNSILFARMLLVFILCSFSFLLQPHAQSTQTINNGYLIKYNTHYIYPGKTSISLSNRITPSFNFEGKGYYLLALKGAITDNIKEQLTSLGGEILRFLPKNGILIRCTNEDFIRISALEIVSFADHFSPEFVLSRSLADVSKATPLVDKDGNVSSNKLALSVHIFPGENLTRISNRIRELGGTIQGQHSSQDYHRMRIVFPRHQLMNLASIPGLSHVNTQVTYETYSDVAQGVMNINAVRTELGLRGNNQKIAIADNGLDSGVTGASLHDDLEANTERIISKPVIPGAIITDCGNGVEIMRIPNPSTASLDDGAADENNGHGTHVASLAVGNGSMSGGQYAGVAPEARLVFQAMEQYTYHNDPSYNGYKLSGVPLDDLGSLFQEAYDLGARIHSNSWGPSSGCEDGNYLNETRAIDEFTWQNQDMLVLFSAGNGGKDDDKDSVVDTGSMSALGMAKNILTIGASENNRPSFTNTNRRFGLYKFGNTIADDRTADNPEGLAASSSRGLPHHRIKPDAVAPGTFVVGARSQAAPNDIVFLQNAEDNSNPWQGQNQMTKMAGQGRNASTGWHDSPNGNSPDDYNRYYTLNPIDISTAGKGRKLLRFWTRYEFADKDRCRLTITDVNSNEFIEIDLVGTVSEWEQLTIDLKDLSDATQLQIEFRMIVFQDGISGDGLYFDDLMIIEGAFGDGTLSEFGLTNPNSTIDQNYILYSGTSMATPLVAGVAALVREYYTERLGLDYVSAPLLRATILNGTVDLSPGQYGTNAPQEINGQPDIGQGWGLVDAESILVPSLPSRLDHIDETIGLSTNETREYTYKVIDPSVPLSITMVYHDYPGQDLVNHLDLKIIDPNGQEFFPNGLNIPDELNNVERVNVTNPVLGSYTIRISATNVPMGPQPFAIATRGAGSIAQPPRQPVEIMLVLDLSGSMLRKACPEPDCSSKLVRLKEAVELFLQLWNQVQVNGDKIGITYFRTNVDHLELLNSPLPPFDALALIKNVKLQKTLRSEQTAMGGGLQFAINTLQNNGSSAKKFVILFTDGKQNMNPMVLRNIWTTRRGLLQIRNRSGQPVSNIPPTDPVTQINTALGITINTIGIGTPAHVTDLLANIADDTDGAFIQTNVPDEELRQVFIEQLINVIRGNTPQLIDYRYPETDRRGAATETFSVNQTAAKLLFSVSWDKTSDLKFEVTKDGQNVTNQIKEVQRGSFYQILSFEPNSSIPNLGGEWQLSFHGQNGTPFEVAAIVDEIELDLKITANALHIPAGENISLALSATLDKKPLPSALDINATVVRPRLGFGNLFVRNQKRLSSDLLGINSTLFSESEAVFDLLDRTDFWRKLRTKEEEVQITRGANGLSVGEFSKTSVAGVYSFNFEINGYHPTVGEFTRLEQIDINVGVDIPDLKRSDVRTKSMGQGQYKITIAPKDQFGNLYGPGYADALKLRLEENSDLLPFVDNGDGKYSLITTLPKRRKSKVALQAFSEDVFEGPFRRLGPAKFYLALQYGQSYYVENRNELDAGNPLLGAGLGINFSPSVSLLLNGKYLDSSENKEAILASAELKWLLSTRTIRPYIKAGPAYLIDSMTTGLTAGLGLQFRLFPRIQLTAGADYFTPFGSMETRDLLQLQVGVVRDF